MPAFIRCHLWGCWGTSHVCMAASGNDGSVCWQFAHATSWHCCDQLDVWSFLPKNRQLVCFPDGTACLSTGLCYIVQKCWPVITSKTCSLEWYYWIYLSITFWKIIGCELFLVVFSKYSCLSLSITRSWSGACTGLQGSLRGFIGWCRAFILAWSSACVWKEQEREGCNCWPPTYRYFGNKEPMMDMLEAL